MEMSAPVRQRRGEPIEKGSLMPIRRWACRRSKTVVSLATGALPYTIGRSSTSMAACWRFACEPVCGWEE
jgi:hypothetical protein